MRIHSAFLATITAMAFAAAPVAAQAATSKAKPATEAVKRAAPAKKAENKMGGDSTLLLILAVILIGAGIFVLADNEDDSPTSP